MTEEEHMAQIDRALDVILVEMRVADVVKRDCLCGPAECGWPECGCDPQVFAQDILAANPKL
jgi:hypothetical protein